MWKLSRSDDLKPSLYRQVCRAKFRSRANKGGRAAVGAKRTATTKCSRFRSRQLLIPVQTDYFRDRGYVRWDGFHPKKRMAAIRQNVFEELKRLSRRRSVSSSLQGCPSFSKLEDCLCSFCWVCTRSLDWGDSRIAYSGSFGTSMTCAPDMPFETDLEPSELRSRLRPLKRWLIKRSSSTALGRMPSYAAGVSGHSGDPASNVGNSGDTCPTLGLPRTAARADEPTFAPQPDRLLGR